MLFIRCKRIFFNEIKIIQNYKYNIYNSRLLNFFILRTKILLNYIYAVEKIIYYKINCLIFKIYIIHRNINYFILY